MSTSSTWIRRRSHRRTRRYQHAAAREQQIRIRLWHWRHDDARVRATQYTARRTTRRRRLCKATSCAATAAIVAIACASTDAGGWRCSDRGRRRVRCGGRRRRARRRCDGARTRRQLRPAAGAGAGAQRDARTGRLRATRRRERLRRRARVLERRRSRVHRHSQFRRRQCCLFAKATHELCVK